MNVTFYTIVKRQNSTKIPDTSGTTLQAFLKDKTDVLSPVLEIQSATRPTSWNYVFIPEFARYYYVTSWSADKGLWIASCKVDHLASWKQYILQTNCLLQFSDSEAASKFLIDDRIMRRTTFQTATVEAAMDGIISPFDGASGIFGLVTFNNGGLQALAATQVYYVSWQVLREIMSGLMDTDFWEELKTYFNNPFDAIIDCFYLPISALQFFKNGTEGLFVKFGQQELDIYGDVPIGTAFDVVSKHVTMDIPWRYDDFRRCEPWTKLELLVPFCGVVPLDSSALAPYEKIQIDYTIDPLSGAVDAVISPYAADGNISVIVGEAHGNCKIQVPLALTQPRTGDYIGGAITSLGGIAAGVMSGNPNTAGMGMIRGIGSVFSPATHKKIGGSGGTIVDAILGDGKLQKFRLSQTAYDGTILPANLKPIMGMPTNLNATLNGFSGYVQTEGFSVQAPAYEPEISAINSDLDRGIFIE